MVDRRGKARFLEDAVVLSGILVTLIVIVLVARVAGKALKSAIPELIPVAAGAKS